MKQQRKAKKLAVKPSEIKVIFARKEFHNNTKTTRTRTRTEQTRKDKKTLNSKANKIEQKKELSAIEEQKVSKVKIDSYVKREICTKDNNNNKMVVEAMQQIQSYHQQKQQLPNPMDIKMDYSKMGRTVKSALMKAQTESRVIVGLSAAIKVLSKAPEGSLFCLMAVPQAGDSATHMHEVLLEAFCYENDIYVIKVDCPIKLSRILGKTNVESCCLVQKTWTGEQADEQLNKPESMLVDFCEAYWDASENPVVELPNV